MVEREQCRKEPEPSGRGTQVVAAMHRKLKEKVKYRCQMKCCKETRRSTRHSITRPSKNNAMGPLISIGAKDLTEMIRDGKPIEVNCHFCNTNYTFTVEELRELLKKSR